MNRFRRPPPLSLSDQFYGLKARYPEGTGKIINHDRTLVWQCDLTPCLFSRSYRLLVRYTRGMLPECIVLSPDLNALAAGRIIPHTYGNDESTGGKKLCLFLPRKQSETGLHEWRSQMALNATILPWASLWLYYFEDWLFSDDWKGGGAHPADNETGIIIDESWK